MTDHVEGHSYHTFVFNICNILQYLSIISGRSVENPESRNKILRRDKDVGRDPEGTVTR